VFSQGVMFGGGHVYPKQAVMKMINHTKENPMIFLIFNFI
jgi:UDP-N-acetylglucosamine:LPS N-acetylglucosamine transferase